MVKDGTQSSCSKLLSIDVGWVGVVGSWQEEWWRGKFKGQV